MKKKNNKNNNKKKNMYVLNFAKASPSSTAVVRLLRRRGVFLTKESFSYNAR